MQVRFYDSAEPGPPHGWLDADQGVPSTERLIWENAVSTMQQASRRLADSLRGGESSPLLWGCLHAGGPWWIYHVLPAGEDRFGRPGRTLTVLFCSGSKEGFEWGTINAVIPEMEALARNRHHLTSLLGQMDRSPSSGSLTDALLKRPSTSSHGALKAEMACSLDRLGEGGHEYFTISADGTISNRGREDLSPKPLLPRTTAPPTSKPTPLQKPLTASSSLMEIFTNSICLGFGVLLGFVAYPVWATKTAVEKPLQDPITINSNEDAIKYLRSATNYLAEHLLKNKDVSSEGSSSPASISGAKSTQNK